MTSQKRSVDVSQSLAQLKILESNKNRLALNLAGELSAKSTAEVWEESMSVIEKNSPALIELDASDVVYCDGIGIAYIMAVKHRQSIRSAAFQLKGLKPEFHKLLDIYSIEKTSALSAPQSSSSPIETLGKRFSSLLNDVQDQVAFAGELFCCLCSGLKNPSKDLRWKDIWNVVEKSGVEALPIIILINFLMGLILAFQSAIPMRTMGVDIYVADLVALCILRVLGPVMTAVVLVGRTGSAFAAELGTMKVNEEIDALRTMGLDPVKFLVTNRVIGLMILFPILTLVADLAGLLGSAVVVTSFGYSLATYYHQIVQAVRLTDFMGGFIKSFAFGIIIATIGCLRGLQTKSGASAVGHAATSSVVSGLVLIIVTEMVFAVVYYFLGI